MAITKLTKWVTSDSKEFISLAEAEEHESVTELKEFCVSQAYYLHDDDPDFEKLAKALLAHYTLTPKEE